MFERIFQVPEYMTLLSSLATTGIIGLSFGGKLFFQSKYRKLIQCKDKDENDLKINEDVNEIIEKVLNRIQLDSRSEIKLKFFASSLGDPTYFGSLQMVLKAYIGLPKSFMYKTRADVDNILLSGGALSLPPDVAAKFIDSFFISDKAKAFAIARQIKYVNSFTFHTDIMLKSVALLSTIFASHYIRNFFQLKRRLKLWSRGILYSMIGGVFYSMSVILMDTYTTYLDTKVDKQAANLTTAYAEGGVEFYNKILIRNQILHAHTPTGAYLYTAAGNEKMGLIRHRHANITTRLKVVKDELVKMKEKAIEKEKEENRNKDKSDHIVISNNNLAPNKVVSSS